MSERTSTNPIGDLRTIIEDAKGDLTTPVSIEPARGVPSIGSLLMEKSGGKYVWKQVEDVAVVATDLKASTSLSYAPKTQDRVGARLYQASTGGCARVFRSFGPDFVDIQGDGLFAIFGGDGFLERAMAAAISLNTFGHRLKPMLAEEFGAQAPEMKRSGLKIGVARGALLVKLIGVRGKEKQEPVWAGKPVNYATKCAQAADAGEVIVTAKFFKDFRKNQYVRFTCGCVNGEPKNQFRPLWEELELDRLGNDRAARRLRSRWCDRCGPRFCRALLAGAQERDELEGIDLKKWREPDSATPS